MTHFDDSLALTVPTSGFSAGTVSTEDRPTLTGLDPPMDWHTLNSFLPIFELLGDKFVLDQNAYFIHGLVDNNDFEILQSYSSLVTEFILTKVEKNKPIIAPSTFLHIAQFLNPNSGLLPSLSRLRIIQADEYFSCLHLLFTPSLRTLEAKNVPEHQHQIFFSFLTTLVHKAPLLDEIILGPDQFPLKSLQEIPKFTNLRQLELRDVASAIDFTFLQDVGTLLKLESFILDARSCTYYAARIPEEQPIKTPPAEQTEVGSQMPQPSDIDDSAIFEDTTEVNTVDIFSPSDIEGDGPSLVVYPSLSRPSSPTIGIGEDKNVVQLPPPINNQITCNEDSSISAVGGFYQLKKFHFIGGLSLLQDIIPYIASSTLEDISITVIRPWPLVSLQDLRQELEVELAVEIETMEQTTRAEYGHGSRVRRILTSRRQVILEQAVSRRKEQEAQYERKKAEEYYQKHITILQTVSSRWSADLKTVKFSNLEGSPQSLPTLPVLPKGVYGPLFCHPNLEILEFNQWRIDSINDLLLCMKSSGPNNLKQLRLPGDDLDSAVSLSGLLDIGEASPMLESLYCCIDTLPPIPEYSIPTTKALSHGLQSLFVANDPTSLWDFNQLVLVARYFYLTFPRLQTIDSVKGQNAEQWERIRDLVKMFQVIRQDDKYR